MNRLNKMRALLTFLVAAGTLQPGLAQGCAMCKTSLAGQGQNVVGALQIGILVLLIPPLAILGTFLYIALRREEGVPERPPSGS